MEEYEHTKPKLDDSFFNGIIIEKVLDEEIVEQYGDVIELTDKKKRHFLLSHRTFEMVNNYTRGILGKKIEEAISNKDCATICDIGGGYTSRCILDILSKYHHDKLHGYNLDIFHQPTQQTNPRLLKIQGNIENIPLRNDSIDIAYSWQLIDYIYRRNEDTESYMSHIYSEISRIVKPGGVAIINDETLFNMLNTNRQYRHSFIQANRFYDMTLYADKDKDIFFSGFVEMRKTS